MQSSHFGRFSVAHVMVKVVVHVPQEICQVRHQQTKKNTFSASPGYSYTLCFYTFAFGFFSYIPWFFVVFFLAYLKSQSCGYVSDVCERENVDFGVSVDPVMVSVVLN